jgi:predicted MFS family arabinose efflux permease
MAALGGLAPAELASLAADFERFSSLAPKPVEGEEAWAAALPPRVQRRVRGRLLSKAEFVRFVRGLPVGPAAGEPGRRASTGRGGRSAASGNDASDDEALDASRGAGLAAISGDLFTDAVFASNRSPAGMAFDEYAQLCAVVNSPRASRKVAWLYALVTRQPLAAHARLRLDGPLRESDVSGASARELSDLFFAAVAAGATGEPLAPPIAPARFCRLFHGAAVLWARHARAIKALLASRAGGPDAAERGDDDAMQRNGSDLAFLSQRAARGLTPLFLKHSGGGGRISAAGLESLLRDVGLRGTRRICELLVSLCHAKLHPNTASFQDVFELAYLAAHGSRRAFLAFLFRAADADGDGRISREDAARILEAIEPIEAAGEDTGPRSGRRDPNGVVASTGAGAGAGAGASAAHPAVANLMAASSIFALLASLCFEDAEAEAKAEAAESATFDFDSLLAAFTRWELRFDLIGGLMALLGDSWARAVSASESKVDGGDVVQMVELGGKKLRLVSESAVSDGGDGDKPAAAKRPADGVAAPTKVAQPSEFTPRKVAFMLVVILMELPFFFLSALASVQGSSFREFFGVSEALLGLLGSMQIIGYMLGLFSSGWLVVRVGHLTTARMNAMISLCGCVPAFLAVRVSSFWLLMLAMFLWGLGDNYYVATLLLGKHFSRSLAFSFGISNSMYTLSIAFASLVLPLTRRYSLALPVDVCAYSVLLAVALTFLAAELDKRMRAHGGDDADSSSSNAVAGAKVGGPAKRRVGDLNDTATLLALQRSVRELVPKDEERQAVDRRGGGRAGGGRCCRCCPSPRFPLLYWLISLNAFFTYGVLMSSFWFFPLYMQDEVGLSESSASLLLPGLSNLVGVLLNPTSGRFFDRRGLRLSVLGTSTLASLSTLVLAWAYPSVATSVALSLVQGALFSVARSFGVPVVQMILSESLRAAGVSLHLIIYCLAVVSYSTLGGVIIDKGGYTSYFALGILSHLVGIFIVFAMFSEDHRASRGRLNAPASALSVRPLPLVAYQAANAPPGPASGNGADPRFKTMRQVSLFFRRSQRFGAL